MEYINDGIYILLKRKLSICPFILCKEGVIDS
jgi:hypothetical protein